MDRIGTIMGVVTIPMALLTLASAAAALWLLATGTIMLVLAGVLALVVGLVLAWATDRAAEAAEDLAMAVRRRCGAVLGQVAALACGIAPMAVLLGWEYAVFAHIVQPRVVTGAAIAAWLFSYGVATVPWTVHAQLVGSDRRTLCGIRAYAGHLGYWLLGLAVAFGASLPMALATMALPAILPVTVGALLAVADREALRNVRI